MYRFLILLIFIFKYSIGVGQVSSKRNNNVEFYKKKLENLTLSNFTIDTTHKKRLDSLSRSYYIFGKSFPSVINKYDSLILFNKRLKSITKNYFILGKSECISSIAFGASLDFRNQLISIIKSLEYFNQSKDENSGQCKIMMLIELLSFYQKHNIYSNSNALISMIKFEYKLLLSSNKDITSYAKLKLDILECAYLSHTKNFEKAKQLLDNILDLKRIDQFNKELSEIYYYNNDISKSYYYLLRYFETQNPISAEQNILLIKYYLIKNDLEKCKELISFLNLKDLLYLSKIPEYQDILSKYYEKNNNFRSAYQFLKNNKSIRDSLSQQNLNILDIYKKNDNSFNLGNEDQNLNTYKDGKGDSEKTLFFIVSLMLFVFITLFFYNKKSQFISNLELEKTKELLAFKTTFFENVSHEMRTPITIIIGYLQLINENIFKPTKIRYLINLATNNCQELLESLNVLLRIDNNNFRKIITSKSINDFVKEQLKAFLSRIEIKKVSIYFKTNVNDDLKIDLSYNFLGQIITNLVDNAIKYSKPKSKIYVSVIVNKMELIIAVRDEGIGIKKEEQEIIFSRFYQARTSTDYGGFGIGLSVVEKLTTKLNGKINVESKLNKGSIFTLNIPIDIKDYNLSTNLIDTEYVLINIQIENNETDINYQELPKALIVDDNLDMIKFYQEIFNSELDCLYAFDGNEAYETLIQNDIDIIIADYRMPKMNGKHFKLKINQLEKFKDIPFIMISAKEIYDNGDLKSSIGISDFLVKPFNKNEVLAKIKSLLKNNIYYKNLFLDIKLTNNYKDQYSDILIEIKKIIKNNINNPELSAPFLSKKLNLSTKKINNILQEKVGLTFIGVVSEMRLLISYDLIINNKFETIKEVMYNVGFNSRPNFYKKFYDKFGIKPGDLKSKFKKI